MEQYFSLTTNQPQPLLRISPTEQPQLVQEHVDTLNIGVQERKQAVNMSKRQITKATANKVRVYLLLLLELLPGDGVRLVKAGQARRMPLWRTKKSRTQRNGEKKREAKGAESVRPLRR